MKEVLLNRADYRLKGAKGSVSCSHRMYCGKETLLNLLTSCGFAEAGLIQALRERYHEHTEYRLLSSVN